MKKLKLGRTGLDISQVILGGGWVGGLFMGLGGLLSLLKRIENRQLKKISLYL